MLLTRQFNLATMTHSDTALRYGIDNTPSFEVVDKLLALYTNVLHPLVAELPGVLYVNCGYRSPQLNARVGGKPDSQHCKGEAADLEYYENEIENNQVIIDTVKRLGLPYDQMIDERNLAWVHLSYRASNNRNMFLKL